MQNQIMTSPTFPTILFFILQETKSFLTDDHMLQLDIPSLQTDHTTAESHLSGADYPGCRLLGAFV
jgi:hypothetical protein